MKVLIFEKSSFWIVKAHAIKVTGFSLNTLGNRVLNFVSKNCKHFERNVVEC